MWSLQKYFEKFYLFFSVPPLKNISRYSLILTFLNAPKQAVYESDCSKKADLLETPLHKTENIPLFLCCSSVKRFLVLIFAGIQIR